MGQYFQVFNQNKEQFIAPQGHKAVEATSTPINGGVLLYLLCDNIPQEDDPAGLAGSWAEDEIRIQGDYHESDIYDVTRLRYKITHGGETFVTTTSPTGPVKVETSSFNFGDKFSSYSTTYTREPQRTRKKRNLIHLERRDIESGDYGVMPTRFDDHFDEEGGYTIVKVEECLDPLWDEKTTEYENAFLEFIDDNEWEEAQAEATILRPDVVVTTDDDGNSMQVTGSETIISPDRTNTEKTTLATYATNQTEDQPSHLIVNIDKKEYYPPTAPETLQSAITSPVTNGLLVYLLFDSVQDGTRFTNLHNPYAPQWEDEIADRKKEEREKYLNSGRSSPYRREDGSWNKPKLTGVLASKHNISEDFLYAGSWQGDNVQLVKSDSDIGANVSRDNGWVNISDRLHDVFAGFVSQEWIDEWRDLVVQNKESITQ